MKRLLLILCLGCSFYSYSQQIEEGEYYFDTDPGIGAGIPLNISPGPSVNTELNITINQLTEGFHTLFVRLKNSKGNWSLYSKRVFYILKPTSVANAQITYMEYFIGQDPGPGNGTPIDFGASAPLIDTEIAIDLASENLTDGDYVISIRVKDSEGTWSLFTTRQFTICATAAVYYQDLDNDGFGNADSLIYACFQPAGYVANNLDCDDQVQEVNTSAVDWYLDADEDGFGDPNTIINDCARPDGYVLVAGDCDDSDAELNPDKVWYEDLDGDGFGRPTKVRAGCEQPAGYVANNLDCNDDDETINPQTQWYEDTDNDGFGNPSVVQIACSQPFGFVQNNQDCNDNEQLIGAATVWYRDLDNDGFGNSDITLTQCTQPTGYVDIGDDCDDGDALVGSPRDWYRDADGDGIGVDTDVLNSCSQPTGYVLDVGDCDDTNSDIIGQTWYLDQDGDGFGTTADTRVQCDQPDGYAPNADDCNDSNSGIKGPQLWYFDNDLDGFGNPDIDSLSCSGPDGYVLASNGFDCNDNDAVVLAAPLWYFDFDQDGYGGDSTRFDCTQPVGFVDRGGDCKDSIPEINPETRWYRDLDGDTFGTTDFIITGCDQPDGYVIDNTDCDDNDALVFPGAEAQPDGKDNDCDGEIDRATQVITFETIGDLEDNASPVLLVGTSDSDLSVAYTTEGPATIDGSTLTVTGPGSLTIKAYQEGDNRYLPADTVAITICVNPVPVAEVLPGLALLSSNYETGNQWLLNGAELPGATGQTYEALESGNYSVRVTFDDCSATSAEKAVQLGLVNVNPLSITSQFSQSFDGDTVVTIRPREGAPPYTVSFEYRALENPNASTISRTVLRDSIFRFELTESVIGDIGLVFSATVTDQTGSSESASGQIYRVFDDESSPVIPNLSFGGAVGNYRIISIPYELENSTIDVVFEELGDYNAEQWRLLRWNGSGWNQPGAGLSLIRPGEGYFFNALERVEIKIGAGTTNKAEKFRMTLRRGFNQIGNPYNIPISWEEVRSSPDIDANIVGALKIFNPSTISYTDGDLMEAFTGGFVFSEEQETIEIDPAQATPNLRTRSNPGIESRDISSPEWFIPVSVRQGASVTELGGPGMHPEAKIHFDRFDDMTVPRFIDFTEMVSYHEDYFYPKFSADVVPSSGSWSWDFTIESNVVSGPTILEWPRLDDQLDIAELWLIDHTSGAIINMEDINSYPIRLDGEHKLSIQYLNGSGELTAVSLLGNPFPNPTADRSRIPLLLSSEDRNASVRLDVMDLNGRLINTLYNGTPGAGVHYFEWDSRTGEGVQVGRGVYMYQVTIDDKRRQIKRLIIN